jgi:hypothetical protein
MISGPALSHSNASSRASAACISRHYKSGVINILKYYDDMNLRAVYIERIRNYGIPKKKIASLLFFGNYVQN